MTAIANAHILIMATDGFEESELFGPREILLGQRARVSLASPSLTTIQATVLDDPGRTIRPDLKIADARAADYDALVLPGGVINPDSLRTNGEAIALIRAFVAAGKPVAAICHGPWLLVEADVIRGKRVTAWPSIRTDLRNAGGEVVEEAAVIDDNILTSRSPADVPVFTDALIAMIEGRA